jgi:hypothetical protein
MAPLVTERGLFHVKHAPSPGGIRFRRAARRAFVPGSAAWSDAALFHVKRRSGSPADVIVGYVPGERRGPDCPMPAGSEVKGQAMIESLIVRQIQAGH